MGPRNRRRLGIGGIAAAVVIAAVAVVMIIHHSSGGSGSAVTGQSAQRRSNTASLRATHLFFGMTPQQVQHFAGRAQKMRGNCWYYTPVRTQAGTRVGALNVGVPGTPSMTSNQIKLCFFSGVLSFEYTHMLTPNKGWQWNEALF